MKRLLFILLFLFMAAGQAQAQYWGSYSRLGPWVVVTPTNNEECNTSFIVYGGVTYGELHDHNLFTIGSGIEGKAYYEFWGEWEMYPPDTANRPYLMWPPSRITTDMLFQGRNNVWYYEGCDNCGCDDLYPILPDTTTLIEAFGFWHCNSPNNCGFMPGINSGYIMHVSHPSICLSEPCPSYDPDPKRYLTISFADSTYRPLPDTGNFIISGDSPLYITAHSFDVLDKLWAWVILEKYPIKPDSINLQRASLHDWRGKSHKTGRQLGLKSYARAAVLASIGSVNAMDEVDLCLPLVVPSRDTIIIRTDSMKISENPSVCLYIIDDSTGNIISTNEVVQSAGYKYKSRWTANANRPLDHKTYYRQFPSSIFYRQWNGTAPRCQVTFNRDSLYMVGGLLTIECKGQIKIPDTLYKINNGFLVSTDTPPANGHDTLQTMRILVDYDPENSVFETALIRDRIRALSWKEGAGSVAELPQHPQGHVQWNHYWFDTYTPCENAHSTATGIMQVLRTSWENAFLNGMPLPPVDTGYTPVTWDSLAWNWRVAIRNGKFIHDIYMYNRIIRNATQKLFPDSCPFTNCAFFPSKKKGGSKNLWLQNE